MIVNEDRSYGQLLGDTLSQLAKLMQSEVDLARAELRAKVDMTLGAVKLIGAGASLCIPAIVLMLMAFAAWLIQLGAPAPLAYFCPGAAAGIVAWILIASGMGRISADTLTPKASLEEIKRDRIATREIFR